MVSTVDEYLEGFAADRRATLEGVREAIHRGVPNGDERIRYGMPAIILGGRYALHFAGWKKHIGLYPVPRFDEPLENEVAPHRSEKDSVTFPWSDPLPLDLIERIAAEIAAQRTPEGPNQ
ncbi:iron chaperone [Mycetocola zhadangensis]|uniref:iron chaperone n=1 Tax=Mycetocola zhadangensis TaxID=1164595 RepID=UPI003A4E2EB7